MAGALACFAVVSAGCAGKKNRDAAAAQAPKETLYGAISGPGSAQRFVLDGDNRRRAWDVSWKKATLYTDSLNGVYGTMSEPTGTLMQHGKPAAVFSGLTATAEKSTGNLSLGGNIVIRSSNPTAKMTCDHMVWLPKEEIVKAQGHVRVESPEYTIGEFGELWATPDLKEIGTPDVFHALEGAKQGTHGKP